MEIVCDCGNKMQFLSAIGTKDKTFWEYKCPNCHKIKKGVIKNEVYK